MYIIVGLGNPGSKYEDTRHNVGFKVIDILAAQFNIDVSKKKFQALVGEGSIFGTKVILIKPQTYMNLSGESVRKVINWHKTALSNLIIIYDDVDLPVGKLRIRMQGSAGTHNGMRSVIQQIQTEDFPRIRIGVGKPTIIDFDLADFVLSRFLSEERPEIESSLENAAEAVKVIIKDGIGNAMNKYNGN